MVRATASASLSMGMVVIPFKLAKASSTETPELTSMCECGSTDQNYVEDDDGNRVECNGCGERFSWWNQLNKKAIEIGDETVPVDGDAIEAAREEAAEDAGQIEKVVSVKRLLLHYNIAKNYYLIPEEDHADQYGALVRVLDERDQAALTYWQLRNSTERYALVSEGGVMMAFQLAEKRPVEVPEYDVDEMIEQQAGQMLDQFEDDDPDLPNREADALKEVIRDAAEIDEGEEEVTEEAVAEAV